VCDDAVAAAAGCCVDGLVRANPLERHYRDVMCGRVHTPQDDATRVNAGRLGSVFERNNLKPLELPNVSGIHRIHH
jgi:hypothetical protein